MTARVLFNGHASGDMLSQSRALHYGDGVFRTGLLWRSGLVDADLHWRKLRQDAARLQLDAPDDAMLNADAQALHRVHGAGVFKLVLTRRAGGRGYASTQSQTDRLAFWYPLPATGADIWRLGARVRLSDFKLAGSAILAGVKHLNRLEQVLASRDIGDQDELILCGANGALISGTRSNLFIVCNGQLFTPDLSRCGVAGMMREKIMLIAQHLNIPLTVSQISAAALDQADEILLCNALNGIWPVRQVGERQIDAPGPVTQRLAEQLQHPAWYR